VSCAAALAVLDTIEQDDLLSNVHERGAELEQGLRAIDSPLIREVRGSGLWWGVALTSPSAGVVEAAAAELGLLVNAVQPDVIRLAPPLIVTATDVAEAVSLLSAAFNSPLVAENLQQMKGEPA
jgi:acetylornithine/N-succinyldiaminopimelate aminotransferase